MLTLKSNIEPHYVVGARFSYSGTLGSVTSVDPLSYALKAGRAMFLSPPLALGTIIGKSVAGDRSSVIDGYPPYQPPYNSLADAMAYGSLSTNLSFAYRVLAGQKPFNFDPSGEHNVRHWNVKGTLYPEAAADLYPGLYSYPEDTFGYTSYRINSTWDRTIPVLWLDNLPNNFFGWQPTASITTDANGWPVTVPYYSSGGGASDLFAELDWYFNVYLAENPSRAVHKRAQAFNTVWITYSNYDGEDTGATSGWRSYDYELKILYNKVTTVGSYRVTWSCSCLEDSDVQSRTSPSSSYSIPSSLFACTFSIKCLVDGDRGWSEFSSLPQTGETDTYALAVSPTLVSGPTAQGDAIDVDGFRNRIWDSLSVLGAATVNRLADLRPASFHTTAEAVEDLIEDLDTNMIEAIVELRDVAGMLPELGKLVDAVVAIKSGQPLRTIRDLIDFATATRLQDRFAWAPTRDLLEGGLEQFARAYETLSRKLDGEIPLVGRSSVFRYDLPDNFLMGGQLQVRTKVVAGGSMNDHLRRVLGVRALGFLPTGSSIWDLIPLSFVVDWFANIGGRLRDLESLTLLSAIGPRVVVHSYLVDIPLDEAALSFLGIDSYRSLGAPAVVRLYVREVSQHMPPIRNGSIDFALPVSTPNWATAGSLLWQLA